MHHYHVRNRTAVGTAVPAQPTRTGRSVALDAARHRRIYRDYRARVETLLFDE